MDPSTRQLLSDLDPLGHDLRLRYTALTALRHSQTGSIQPLLRDLFAGNAHARRLGVCASAAIGADARVLAALVDPSRLTRRMAANLASRCRVPELIAAVALRLDPHTRKRLVLSLRRRRRADVAVALAPLLIDVGLTADAARLLPLLPEAQAQILLARLPPEQIPWRPLAKIYPRLSLTTIQANFDGSEQHDHPSDWRRLSPALLPLAHFDAAGLLELIEAHNGIQTALQSPAIGHLLAHAPQTVIGLMTAPARRARLLSVGLPGGVLRRLRSLPAAIVHQLVAAIASAPKLLASVLMALPPSRRPVVLEVARSCLGSGAAFSSTVLETLPRFVRHAQARRQLTALKSAPLTERLELMAHLPLDDALSAFIMAARAETPTERGQAYRLLIRCAGRQRQGMLRVLTVVLRLVTAHRTVRLAVLRGLANVPSSAFRTEDAEALAEVLSLSHGLEEAQASVSALCVRALETHTPQSALGTVALDTLVTLAQRGGPVALASSVTTLPPRPLRVLLGRLHPVLRELAAEGQDGPVLDFIERLPATCRYQPQLLGILHDCLGKPGETGERAARLWLTGPGRADRAQHLLDTFPSLRTGPALFDWIQRHSPAALDASLASPLSAIAQIAGLVTPKSARWWLPRQQQALGAAIVRLAQDPQRPAWSLPRSLSLIADLQVTRATDLAPFLGGNRAAGGLRALARIDRPLDALRVIETHFEQAPFEAANTLARLGRSVSPEPVIAVAGRLLDGAACTPPARVRLLTLLAGYRDPSAAALLARQCRISTTDEHTLRGLGRAARRTMDTDWAWAIFEELITRGKVQPEIAAVALEPSVASVPLRWRARYLGLLLKLDEGDEDTTTLLHEALVARGWCETAGAQIGRIASQVILDLQRADWKAAARSLVCSVGRPGTQEVLRATFDGLLSSAVAEPNEPGPHRDLPAHQRLVALSRLLSGIEAGRPNGLGALFLGIFEQLREWPRFDRESARMLIAGVAPLPSAEAATTLLRYTRLSSERLRAQLEFELGQILGDRRSPWTHHAMRDLVAALSEHADGHALAVQTLDAMCRRRGWTPKDRALLGTLRNSADGAARALAHRVWTASE